MCEKLKYIQYTMSFTFFFFFFIVYELIIFIVANAQQIPT